MVYPEFRQIKTARLLLRKLRREDAARFFRFAGSETVTKSMLWVPHGDMSESEASIERTLARYETGKCYRWGIALAESDELIGMIDLLGFEEKTNSCSFAYMIAEEFWGRGYGTEALKAVLGFAFQELKVDAVEADHFCSNPASGAVMKKAGMIYQGSIPEKYGKNGKIYDAVCYRITKEQWKMGIS